MPGKGPSWFTALFVGGFVISAGAQVAMHFFAEHSELLGFVNLGALLAAFAGGTMILYKWW